MRKEIIGILMGVTLSVNVSGQNWGLLNEFMKLPEDGTTFDIESENYDKGVVKKPQDIYGDASKKSIKVGEIGIGGVLNILTRGEEWTKLNLTGNKIGYIRSSKIVTGFDMDEYIEGNNEVFTKYGILKADGVRLRDEKDESSLILKVLWLGDRVEVVREYEDKEWVKCRDASGNVGYIKGEYLDIKIEFEDVNMIDLAESSSEYAQYTSWLDIKGDKEISEMQRSIVEEAKKYLGNPYVWGGNDLENGVDCSGYVREIYRMFGVILPRTSLEQSEVGKEINIQDIEEGDLLFYIDDKTGVVGHVAMYIGNKQVIHASNPKDGIKISSIGYREPCVIRRLAY